MKVNSHLLRWSRQIHIYLSVLLLVLLVFFGVTGITLNHNNWVSDPVVNETIVNINNWTGNELLGQTNAQQLLVVLQSQLGFPLDETQIEFESDLVLLDWQLAGESYQVEFEPELSQAIVFHTDYGLLAKLNDIHKGRHTNAIWNAVIDISGALVVLFSLTGFVLLMPNKKKLRPTLILGVISSSALLITAVMV